MNIIVAIIFLLCGLTSAKIRHHLEEANSFEIIAQAFPRSELPEESRKWSFIYPGTKWCGPGNRASHDNDLGTYTRTDHCCRDHDKCPEKIVGGTTKFGIHNNNRISLLSCRCDQIFYDCLKAVQTKDSKIVGTLYFDVLQNRCFERAAGSDKFIVVRKRLFFSNNPNVQIIDELFG